MDSYGCALLFLLALIGLATMGLTIIALELGVPQILVGVMIGLAIALAFFTMIAAKVAAEEGR